MTNRLIDIVVEEVSLVDRAANNHRFLIVKRSDEMSGDTEDAAGEPLEDLNATSDADDAEETTAAPSPDAPSPTPLEQVLGTLKELTTRVDAVLARATPPASTPPSACASSPPAPPPPPATPSVAPDGEVANALAALTKSFEQLGIAVKGQGQRLSQLEKRTGVPASLPAGETPRRAPQTVSWPLDMNSPRGRTDVAKEMSFHGAEEDSQ